MLEKVKFENRSGQVLAGIMHQPDTGEIRAAALFAHCFTCTKNILAAGNIAQALANEGILVLRFDFTGLGESEGDFVDTDFSANIEDLLDASEYMAREFRAPDILVGHSLGGTAILAAAHHVPSAKAVATIGSPADAQHVLHLINDDIETIEKVGQAEVSLAGRPFRISRDFLENVRSQSVRDGVKDLRRALLVMHSPVDELVSIQEAARIYTSAMHPKSFVSLDDADHLLADKRDSEYAGQVLAAWAERYLPPRQEEPDPALFVASATVVEGAIQDGFRVSVNANGHIMIGDEPVGVGGTDQGPSPYDLLSAALGTCTVMTLNFFARRENLPLESALIEVSHDHIHARDCEQCETSSGRIDRMMRKITLKGELDEQQRALLMKIADRCPVHKTLLGEMVIENELLSDH